MIEPSIWAKRSTSACWVVTARITSWVPGRRRRGVRSGGAGPSSAGGAGSSVPTTSRFWMIAFTDVGLDVRHRGDAPVLGSMVTTGNFSAPVIPITTSTRSPGLMSVPTPEM